MKRIMAWMLVLLMAVSMCACAGDGENGAEGAQKISEDITLLSCRFADSVHALDGELIGSHYEKIQDRIYVDMVFSVDNNSAEVFNHNNISGWLMYEDVKQELQYCRENERSTGVGDSALGDEYALVHLFIRLPAEAENEELTVNYTVNGKEYTCKVGAKQQEDALAAKMEVKTGDVVSLLDGDYEFEVLEACVIENLQASYQTDSCYIGPFALVKLMVTNNHDRRTLYEIEGYTELDNQWMRISVDIEGGKYTDFDPLYQYGIAPGESRLVYIYVGIDDDTDTQDLMIRFNLCGSCFYAKIQ